MCRVELVVSSELHTQEVIMNDELDKMHEEIESLQKTMLRLIVAMYSHLGEKEAKSLIAELNIDEQ